MSLLRPEPNKPADDAAPSGTDARLQARLLDKVGQAIITTDSQGKVLYWNRAAERLYGWSAKEALGRSIIEVTPSEELMNRAEEIMSELRAGRSWSGEFGVQRKDGTSFTAMATDMPVHDEQGALVAIIGVSTAITELKKNDELHRSAELFWALTQNSSDIVTLLGADGTIRYESPSIERILGYRPEELLGENAFDYVHPEDLGRVQGKFAEGLADPDLRPSAEYRFRRKDGSWCYLESVGSNLLGDPEVGEFVVNSRDITERKWAEERLQLAEARYRTLVERMPAVTYIQEIGGPESALYMSPQIETLTGYSPEDCKDPDLRWRMVHPEDRARMQAEDERAVVPGEVHTTEYRVVHRDGRIAWVRNESVVVEEERSGSHYWQGFMVDITEQKRAEELIKRQADMLEQTHDAVFMWKLGGEIIYWNQGAERLYGWPKEEALGRISHELLKTIRPSASEEELDRVLRSEGHWEGELVHHTRDDRRVIVESRHVLTRYDSGPGFVLETNRDITERKALERHLRYQALHDLLSGLPNRALFMDRLSNALARAGRRPRRVAVMFVDLDNFKFVNDTLGHYAGDELLVAVSERLRTCLRLEDTLARLGGDEFAVLLEDLADEGEATRVAGRLVEKLRVPFTLDNQEVFVTPSIGIALDDSGRDSPERLLRNADVAMYRAKNEGKARYQLFEPSIEAQSTERMRLEHDLRRALERDEFRLYYQPVVGADSARIMGMEALVRWEHPERGLVLPDEFVPLAEETGLIVPIGKWVLREACRQAKEWQERYPSDLPLIVGTNLSARQLEHPDLTDAVEEALRDSGLDPRALTLEITESAVVKDEEHNIDAMRRLAALGIRFALDDFGTGYSALSYLRRLPVGLLKLDRSFLERLGEDAEAEVLLSGVISIASGLGLYVLAEGVETPEQLALVKSLGCDLAQGHYFSEPLPSEALGKILHLERQGPTSAKLKRRAFL